MATLKDIAAKANVHLTTVSLVLNQSKGNSRCSEETREKVLRIAREMGYVRNQLASRLLSRRTNTIGLIAGDIRNPFFAALATSIEEELEKHDYQLLLLCRGFGQNFSRNDVVDAVFEQPVDGFIAWSESAGRAVQQLPKSFPKPVVTIGAPLSGHPGVRLDIGRGLEMAVEYLKRKGHRHIAYYAPEEAQRMGMPQPRPELFERVVEKAGLRRPQMIFYPGQSWDVATACDYAARVKLETTVTALVGFNDIAVLGWRQAVRPVAMEMVSFDGTDWIHLCGRAVPSVRIPTAELARVSVSLLFEQIEGKSGKGRVKPPVVLPEFVNY